MGKGGLKELILEVLHQGLGRNLIYATRPGEWVDARSEHRYYFTEEQL